jgi:Na+-transporting NADH:ubiquinone oxidoreductase subunit A
MSEVIKIRKGLDIHLIGKAEKTLQKLKTSDLYAIKPSDFHGLIPKLLVKADDMVKVGSPLFQDKNKPGIKFTSPVSGKVVAINRGERRTVLEVVVESDGKGESVTFTQGTISSLTRDQVLSTILESGLWPVIQQRPYGILANPVDQPIAVYVSGFDSAPLAPDYEFILKNQMDAFQTGIDALGKLANGKVHLGLSSSSSILAAVKGAQVHYYAGPHPAGNVGVQIHQVKPLNKGEIVWTVGPQEVAMIGKLFLTGVYNPEKIIALAGSEVIKPQYYTVLLGTAVKPVIEANLKEGNNRIISGNVLCGTQISKSGYLSFGDNLLTVLPEGDYYELFGWALPGFNKFSTSRTFFSWLTPNKAYRLDTNYHGGERAFVVSGQYEKVMPMDLLPVHLLKAILAEDIDQMEKLGIYEVIEEDMALCEFVCTSKIEVQDILRKGIDLMVKELS